MEQPFPLTLAGLPRWLHTVEINRAYSELDYSYANVGTPDHGGRYERFLRRFVWAATPSEEVVRRLFNQINSNYADELVTTAGREPISVSVARANALMLFAQGKHIGVRTKEIAFGYRKHLDILDPRRRAKWLRGPDVRDVPALLTQWCETAESGTFDVDAALLMSLLLIAIHPFADANGRMARLVFSMLLARSGCDLLWLDEAEDGELRRTGTGIESTEFLMATLVSELAGGANVIEVDGSSDSSAIAQRLSISLQALATGDRSMLASEAFRNYRAHLGRDGHLVACSPRFVCLRPWLL